jgi:hypothetical protein
LLPPKDDNPASSRPARLRVSALSSPVTFFFVVVLLHAPQILLYAQTQTSSAQSGSPTALPEAPSPRLVIHQKSKIGPCRVVSAQIQAGDAMADGAARQGITHAGLELTPHGRQSSDLSEVADLPPCPPQPIIDWFARFLNGPEVKPLTVKEKARLAVRNLLDPFNAITILGQSAITIASDPDTPYGPGMPGFAKNVGVSYTQDMTGEFLGTFLLPSILHEDPHYHRMPRGSIPRRILHAIVQVAWTQGDSGRGMLNVSNLIGYAASDEISNLYVPGRQTDLPATAARYSIGLGTAPIDNFITEFLPDVARRIHVRVVLVQRIIDQVAKTEGGS